VTVQLKPETERLVEEEIRSGHFHSVDELIVAGVRAWREKYQAAEPDEALPKQRPEGRKSLVQLFAESPFNGLSLDFERFPDTLPPVDP